MIEHWSYECDMKNVFSQDDVQGLIDIIFDCVLIATNPEYGIVDMSTESKAAWVREKLRSCGWDTEPMGASWGMLKD